MPYSDPDGRHFDSDNLICRCSSTHCERTMPYVPNVNQNVACLDDTARTARSGGNFHSPWSAKGAGKLQWSWIQYVHFLPAALRVHAARLVVDGSGGYFGIRRRNTGRARVVDESGSVLNRSDNDSRYLWCSLARFFWRQRH